MIFKNSHPEVFSRKCVLEKYETSAQVFSYEICLIFKSNFCYRTRPVSASEYLQGSFSTKYFRVLFLLKLGMKDKYIDVFLFTGTTL